MGNGWCAESVGEGGTGGGEACSQRVSGPVRAVEFVRRGPQRPTGVVPPRTDPFERRSLEGADRDPQLPDGTRRWDNGCRALLRQEAAQSVQLAIGATAQ